MSRFVPALEKGGMKLRKEHGDFDLSIDGHRYRQEIGRFLVHLHWTCENTG